MSWNLALYAVLALLALATAAAVWWWTLRRVFTLTTRADEVHRIDARDGWPLAIWRHRPRGEARPVPVVLCHGLQANRFNLDFEEGRSLARYLSARGHDVWVVDLRGSGGSREGGGLPHGGFDAHVNFDADAILETVCRVTGAPQAFWVGHSMGGMVAYVLSSGPAAARLAGFVAVGSPVSWRHQHPRLRRIVTRGMRLLKRGLRVRRLGRIATPLVGWVNTWPATATANPRNFPGRVMRRAVYNLVEDLLPDHFEQFGRWIRDDVFCSRDGAVDYRARLAQSRTPALLLAGAGDRLAPPGSVEDAFNRLGSADKRLQVLGRETGCREDYGHGDLLLGRWVDEEVYPLIAAWLEDPLRSD